MDNGLTAKSNFWSMVHGPLSLVHGPWSMVHGLFLVLSFLLACSPFKPASPTLAIVNGSIITLDDFKKAMAAEQWKFGSEFGVSPERLKQLKTQVLETLLKDRLLLAEADKRKIQIPESEVEKSVEQFQSSYTKQDDFAKVLQMRGLSLKDFREERAEEMRIKKLSEQIVAEQSVITEQDLKKYYEAHRSEFQHPGQVHARQIVTDSEEKGEALLKRLEGGGSFEEIAKKYSLSPDRKVGGDLGWFGRGIMPQEFDRVCFNLKLKAFSPVVQTPYGFHLFQVLEIRGAGQLPFDEVVGDLRKRLTELQGRDLFQKWYESLKGQAKIEVHTELLGGGD